MGIGERIRTIREARRVHHPEVAVVAGDEGERLALGRVQAVARTAGPLCRIYPALRVPRSGERGKYEIDLLAVSPYGLVGRALMEQMGL